MLRSDKSIAIGFGRAMSGHNVHLASARVTRQREAVRLCPCAYDFPLDGPRISLRRSMTSKWPPKNLVITVLAIACTVLGYLY